MLILLTAFSAYLVNDISGIMLLNFQLEGRPEEISFISNRWDTTSLRISYFTDFYKLSSIVSFSIAWIGTCALLYHYSRKIGKLKFWILVSLPLLYYLGTADAIKLIIYTYIVLPNPYLSSLIQSVLGGVKQAGGFFFALSFIMISANLDNKKLKYYLMVSSVGIMLLFSSNQISLIQIIPYPPFGLITLSLLSLSAFLVLIGLHGLALSMARDKQLIDDARRIVREKASTFLYDIGSAQWEREMDGALSRIMKSASKTHDDLPVPTSLTAEEIKRYMDEVSDELKKLRKQ